MSLIKLTNSDKVSIIDDDMLDFVSQWKWKLFMKKYVARCVRVGETKQYKVIFLHRIINDTPKNLLTDHINGNGLDNRSINLRNATPYMNQNNRYININNKSGISGVFYQPKHGKSGAFVATARINGKTIKTSYGCYKRGFDKAKEMAINWRKQYEFINNTTVRGNI